MASWKEKSLNSLRRFSAERKLSSSGITGILYIMLKTMLDHNYLYPLHSHHFKLVWYFFLFVMCLKCSSKKYI